MRRLLLVALVAACGGAATGSGGSRSLIVQTTAGQPFAIAAPGGTLQLGAFTQSGDAYGGITLQPVAASWSTSAASVATVDANGLVTAVAPGSADITATDVGATGKVTITVGAPRRRR